MATGKQVYRAALDSLKRALDNDNAEMVDAAVRAVTATVGLGADAPTTGEDA